MRIPTQWPVYLRRKAKAAFKEAANAHNALDNNPHIIDEWMIIGEELSMLANKLEERFEGLFFEHPREKI